jgi:hypothetical protein
MMKIQTLLLIFGWIIVVSCSVKQGDQKESVTENAPGSYGYAAQFLKENTHKLIELSDAEGSAKLLASADYQGRVMTSTASGDSGVSYGWINYKLISSHEKQKQFNPVGGEERFWLGPEGGQYSLYFHPKDSFNIRHWQVPPAIDTISYEVVKQSPTEVVFTRKIQLTNYSKSVFDILIERKIKLLRKDELAYNLGITIPANVKFVGYETENKIQNTGTRDWIRKTGLVSIWLLGMMTPTESTHVIIPFHPEPHAKDLINSTYFGEIPPERLKIKDSVLFFTCDGKFRSKIGLPPSIAKPVSGSFDFKNNVLTIISFPVEKKGAYVNSRWEFQQEPYHGDVANAYNDGPMADGSQLGPFYELESSSPAMELKQGATGTYRQTTCHFTGDFESVSALALQILGVDLRIIK